jgi:DNA-binding NarL/FixJ family response regulator
MCWDRGVSSVLRVLCVEDDPALRGILTAIRGSRQDLDIVVTAGSPAVALAEAETTEFDVALLDLSLGEDNLSGIELGIALREQRPGIGVVILS